jgi:hypothetical protein
MRVAELPLRGSVAELPPNRLDFEERALESTVEVLDGARTVRITEGRGRLRVQIVAGSASERVRDGQRARDPWLVRHLNTTVAKRIRTTCSSKLNRQSPGPRMTPSGWEGVIRHLMATRAQPP